MMVEVPSPQSRLGLAMPCIPGFELGETLSEGATGTTYRATTHDGKVVALKVLPIDVQDGLQVRFILEGHLGGLMEHPDIAKVYARGKTDRHVWMSMELLEGTTLRQRLDAEDLEPAESLRIISRVARALHFAHERGVVHRGVKPQNIFLTKDGGVKLLDFGLARFPHARLRGQRETMGTPKYMAPESLFGHQIDRRADVFSLGVLLFELLAGQCPWEGEEPETQLQNMCMDSPSKLREAAPRIQGLSASQVAKLEAIIEMALQAKPEGRFESALAFARAVSEVMNQDEAPADDEERLLWISVGAVVLALLACIAAMAQ